MRHTLLIFGLLWALGASGQGIYIDSYRFGAAPAANLLLDDYPAQAAYSLRKLRTAYTGDCLVIRRESNNDTLAIGWAGNYMDTTAIANFCSGTTCRVRRWYDQSGNNRDLVQTTNASQPIIYQSGAILVRGTKKTIRGSSSTMFVNFTRNQPHTQTYVGTVNLNTFASDATNANNSASFVNAASQIRIGGLSSNSFVGYTVNVNPANYSLITGLWNGASSRLDINTSTNNTGTVGTDNANGLRIMSSGIGVSGFNNGDIQETIIWTSNNTADWANIQADINSFYNIY